MKRGNLFLGLFSSIFAIVGGSESSSTHHQTILTESVRRLVMDSGWLHSRVGEEYIFPENHEIVDVLKEILGVKGENLSVRVYFLWDGGGSIPVFLTLMKGEKELGYIGLVWSSREAFVLGEIPTMVSVNWVNRPENFVVIKNHGPERLKFQVIFRSDSGRGNNPAVISRKNIFPLPVGEVSVAVPTGNVCLRFLVFD
jgi:hypothetical protein